jgi:RNA polymerase sigma-70 factor (ECF subfamily)
VSGTDADEDVLLADLIRGCANHDQLAFALLYELTARRVYARVYQTLRDVAQSEEVTQDVYLELWTQADRYDPTAAPVLPYLLMVAHRRAVTRVRASVAAARRDASYARTTAEREHDDTSETAMDNLQAGQTRKLLDDLTAAQRQAISLAYLGGHTHNEVAARLNAPLGTIKSRIRDGLQQLRRLVGTAEDA